MDGLIALVTGASGGIGKAIVLRFARPDSRLFVHFFQHRQAAEETAQAAADRGAEVHLLQADLKDEEQIHGMFREIERRCHRLDVLIHNAASGVLRSAMELTPKHWKWVMDTNARSLLLCAKEAASLMRDTRGRIISLSSLGSLRVIPGYGAVGVSKAAMETLTRYLAVELGPRGITVNTISAGAVATEIWKLFPEGEETLDQIRRRTPNGRLVSPEDVAEIAFFLASSQAAMIQGQVIVVDGGYSLLA